MFPFCDRVVDNAKDEATWFVKVDDDAFLFVNNLKRFLLDKDPDKEHWFGHTLHNHVRSGGPPLNAGAVAVMSRATLLKYGAKMKTMKVRVHPEWEQAERDGDEKLAAKLNGLCAQRRPYLGRRAVSLGHRRARRSGQTWA